MNSVFDKPVEVEVQELSEGIAIVIDGDTAPRAIASGQFLYIKNHSTLPTGGYNATAAIASGDTISSSNVIIDADGIANAIKGNIDALNSKTTPEAYSSMTSTVASITQYTKCYKFGKLFVGEFTLITSQAIDAHDAILTNLPIPKDGGIPNFAACTDGSSNGYPLYIDNTGTLRCRLNLLASMALYFSVSYVV